MLRNDDIKVKCGKCGIVVMALPKDQTLKLYLRRLQCPKCNHIGNWSFTKMEVITK